jgi:hypothetical protein
LTGGLIATVALVSATCGSDLHAPPRFDGAGYAVLAEALARGQGYREIDRPGSPRHAHFPPGYPISLAALWRVTGRSDVAAHVFSILCTVTATLAAWRWFRFMESPRVAALLGLALALNWTWARTAGAIQSEPLYLVLAQAAVLAGTRAGRRGGVASGFQAGLLLAVCILTRHVGIAIAAAVGVHLVLQKRLVNGLVAAVTASLCLLPWVVWLATIRVNTQAELLAKDGLPARVIAQALFYVQRMPDQLTGPIVEVGTVFLHSRAAWALVMIWASAATGLLLLGWARSLRTPRRRLAGLVGFLTLGLLVVWPFTEAGRFLIPLVPCLLIGAVEGLAPIVWRAEKALGRRSWPSHPRVAAAVLVLAASCPYAFYALASGRSEAQRRTHADFDAGCSWIAKEGVVPGLVLTRHPGEVYWLTGREALPPGDPAEIRRLLDSSRVAYLLIDDERYANAPDNPLAAFVEQEPGRVRQVWSRTSGGGKSSIRIYEVVPVKSPETHQRPAPSNLRSP